MAKFYGQVFGSANTPATRRGNSDIEVSAQSWNGSVITRLWYNANSELMVTVKADTGSSANGYTVFSGTFAEYIEKLKK